MEEDPRVPGGLARYEVDIAEEVDPAEGEIGAGVVVERICQRRQGARFSEIVAVEDEDVGSGGGSRAGAQCSGHSAVGLADEPNHATGGEVVEDGDCVRVA